MSFEKKVVIITGAGSGIGASTAILFAKEKANVVIVDIDETGAQKVSDKCEVSSNKVLVIKADVAQDKDVQNIIEKVIKEFGRIDILVNNAGIIRVEKILDGSILKTYDQIINTNLRSVVMLTTVAAPHLVQTKGCIINISSLASIAPRLSMSASYSISKAGMISFTQSSALELAPYGVRVNAICPGPVRTSIIKSVYSNNDWDVHAASTALNRILDPEEISDFILYLASNKAKSITGSSHILDAGMLIK